MTAGQPLPERFWDMGFHDLGLYEFGFLALVLAPLFAFWGRRPRPEGFFLTAFAVLYLPVRFFLDDLRVSDIRYIGLTPAQWVAALVFAALPFFAISRPRIRLAVAGVVLLAVGWACTSVGRP